MTATKSISALALCTLLALPAALLPAPVAQAGVVVDLGISVGYAPPPLPVYAQPALPAPGYIWTPGYWAYADGGYYWVPGAWVLPPMVGVLWTPGYWGYYDGFYRWNAGYWGPQVGFYGGVNYGYGYGGVGFVGGRWNRGVFAYNRAVVNFGRTHVTNVYNNTVIVRQNTIINQRRTSYNGGANGIHRRPTAQEVRFGSQRRLPPTANQDAQRRSASLDRERFTPANRGRPATPAAADRPAYANGTRTREANTPRPTAGRGQGQGYQADRSQRPTAVERPVREYRAPNGNRMDGSQRQQTRQYQNVEGRPDVHPQPQRNDRGNVRPQSQQLRRSDGGNFRPQQQQRSDRGNARPQQQQRGDRGNARPQQRGGGGNNGGHRSARNNGQSRG